MNINLNNNSELFLYTENYIFNANVTDDDIEGNDHPDLYYHNRYFSEPKLQSNPYHYTLKNDDQLLNL